MVNTTELRVYMTRRNNMTLTELAKAIGKSPATVSRWFENRDMPMSYAENIAKILKIPEKDMLPIFLLLCSLKSYKSKKRTFFNQICPSGRRGNFDTSMT